MYFEVYISTDKRGFNLKSNFHILFKTYRDKMNLRQQLAAKNPTNYETKRKETIEFEQKPIANFNEFNDAEEEEIQQKPKDAMRYDASKQKRWRQKKQKLREEENRVKEGQMWDRLAELNGEFKKIKKAKKDSKKMSETSYKFV